MTKTKQSIPICVLILFILPTIISVSAIDYPKKIDLVAQIEFIDDFDSQHCEIDLENKRLFLSHQGLKIYNISNPENLEILDESSYQAYGKIKYHNGYLFTIFENAIGQIIRVFEVTTDNQLVYVNESEAFEWAGAHEFYVREMIFTDNNLLFTFGLTRLRCWDISDLNNITCLFTSKLNDMFLDYPPTEAIDFTGVAFHPNETKMLITGNYRIHQTGKIKLFDYSNPSNITRIDFSLDSFVSNESYLIGANIFGLVSNGHYPCFGSGTSNLEMINWTNTFQPVFCTKYQMPRSSHLFQTKMTLFMINQILVYNILSGVVDFSQLDNIHYLNQPDGSTYSLQALREPQILNDYIFFLEDEYISGDGYHYYLSIYKVTPNDSTILTKIDYQLLFIPSTLFVTGFIIKKKRNS
ncbi:MAG: hypothetical protein ACTSO7_16640 [Candidatus Heimdallarchaeota archaeon]